MHTLQEITAAESFRTIEMVEHYFTEMVRDELLELAFPEGDIQHFAQFMGMGRDDDKNLFLIREGLDLDPIGHIVLNMWHARTCMIHFNILCRGWKKSKEIGEDVLKVLHGLHRQDGSPFVRTLLGLTPVTNRAAILYVKRLGFEEVYRVPESYEVLGGVVDSALTVLDLEKKYGKVRRRRSSSHNDAA